MKLKVVIIGGGPAGLLLSEILYHHNIETIVLEKKSRSHVLSRIRAGVLEQTTVDLLKSYGLADRLLKEGKTHAGFKIFWGNNDCIDINLESHVGKILMTYGQSEIQKDLFSAADNRNATVLTEVENIQLLNVDTIHPYVLFTHQGKEQRVDCDFIAGCDGFHGISRKTIPQTHLREFEKKYPFCWLGMLAPTTPLPSITYVNHTRGFALASSRSPCLSRYYIDVPCETKITDWSDDNIWDELKKRFPDHIAKTIQTGASIEKSITRIRSYIVEPLCYGRLFLAGDAAHILPPTGAKGLNLAVSDVFYLSRALIAFYSQGVESLLHSYSNTALKRIWSSMRVAQYMTNLLHRSPFSERAQESELLYLKSSRHAQAALAEQYAGMEF